MTSRLVFWASTLLLSFMMLFAVIVTFVRPMQVEETFKLMGYPTYLITPLAVAKLLGILAIVSRVSAKVQTVAYIGFALNLGFAIYEHYSTNILYFLFASIALVLVLISYLFSKKV